MKTIKELNIKEWSGYFFKEMVNILDIEPEYFVVNDFKVIKDGSVLFNLSYSDESGVPHIGFNNIACIFRKSGSFSYLTFCDNDKNKDMINNYVKIINQLEEELLSCVDEEDEVFNLCDSFMRFKFRTDDNLVYNKKINVPVCAIPLSNVIKRKHIYYPQFNLLKMKVF